MVPKTIRQLYRHKFRPETPGFLWAVKHRVNPINPARTRSTQRYTLVIISSVYTRVRGHREPTERERKRRESYEMDLGRCTGSISRISIITLAVQLNEKGEAAADRRGAVEEEDTGPERRT